MTDDCWREIESNSRILSPDLASLGWWNNKYYLRNPPNDGEQLQTDEAGRSEIPYNREMFWPSNGRFSLGESLPVAYFSNDFAINCCETIEQFRERPLSWGELDVYLSGGIDPTPKLYGYPIEVRLLESAAIFDLTNESLPFFDCLARIVGCPRSEIFSTYLLSKDTSAYPFTQSISRAVRDRGFQALSYESVRAPSGVSLPSRNLVVFDKAIIRRSIYDGTNARD